MKGKKSCPKGCKNKYVDIRCSKWYHILKWEKNMKGEKQCDPKGCWNGKNEWEKKLPKGLIKRTCKYMVFKIIAHLEQTEKRRFHNS